MKVFKMYDTDGTSPDGAAHRLQCTDPSRCIHVHGARLKALHAACAAGAGVITLPMLKRVAKELGEAMSDDEISGMLEHANKSSKPGKGVSFDDFYRLMQKKGGSNALDDLLDDDEGHDDAYGGMEEDGEE